MSSKWDNYYRQAQESNGSPPWESTAPFHGLVEFINTEKLARGSHCVEFGAGSSASAVYLGMSGFVVDAVDISQLAIDRAKQLDMSYNVNWICADLLDQSLFGKFLPKGHYDFVLDMQCFHCLRDINEPIAARNIFDALKPGGYAMVIVGADDPTYRSGLAIPNAPGPPKLSLNSLRDPLEDAGLTTLQLSLSRFNSTEHYANLPHSLPPLGWVGLFQRINWVRNKNKDCSYALEVQYPFSSYILQGKKTIETRAYPLPKELTGQPIMLIEPASGLERISTLPSTIPSGSAVARVIGIVVFESCTKYTSLLDWSKDREYHLVPENSAYDWKDCTVLLESNETKTFSCLDEGKITELFGWKVGSTIETSGRLPALKRVYRSIFELI